MERLTKRNEIGFASLNLKCPEGCKYVTSSFEEGYQCQYQCEGDIIENLQNMRMPRNKAYCCGCLARLEIRFITSKIIKLVNLLFIRLT